MRRVAPLVLALFVGRGLAAQDTAPPPTTPPRSVQFSGLVLVNGFFTNARVNNSDVPQLAEADTTDAAASGGTIRQTRLGVFVTDPQVLGGSFTGELDVDFFGGQQPSSGGRTFPLLRVRRAVGTVQWSHAQLLFGQESPLVAERSPRSLASIGFPDFAGAGNLWLWTPQGRFTFETGYTLRLALQGAVLAPISGSAQSTFATQPDSAERSKRPSLEGRLRLGWGPADDPSEIAVGGHVGWLRSDSVGGRFPDRLARHYRRCAHQAREDRARGRVLQRSSARRPGRRRHRTEPGRRWRRPPHARRMGPDQFQRDPSRRVRRRVRHR